MSPKSCAIKSPECLLEELKIRDNLLFYSHISTEIGPMLAIANNQSLSLLEFVEQEFLEEELANFMKKNNVFVRFGQTKILLSIQNELELYFKGQLKEFETPLCFSGTAFQKKVWSELQRIPFGKTKSYSDIAIAIGQKTAVRAVANANAANQIAVVIPCHRVIQLNGEIGGYAGGVERKQWLLKHEGIHF